MAQSTRSVESLVKLTYALQIATRCSEDAEQICKKNHLTFPDLLRPFSVVSDKIQLKDVQGHLYNLVNATVRFSEPQNEPIPDAKLRMELANVVRNMTSLKNGKVPSTIEVGNIKAQASTPWYEGYRDVFLEHLKQSEHETIKHYVCVVVVVSSSCPDPLESFSKLFTKQKQSEQGKYPKWITPHVYYYHVLLHDSTSCPEARAEDNYEKVKAQYGASSCYLLKINSAGGGGGSTAPGPDLWADYLGPREQGEDDIDGRFKLKFHVGKKSKRKPSANTPTETTPISPNNAHQGEIPNSPGIIAPNVREEAQLMDAEPTGDGEGKGPLSSNSSTSLEVEPGNDPLSQFSASGEGGRGEGGNNSVRKSDSGHQMNALLHGPSDGARYGEYLSSGDHAHLRAFVNELVGKRLLPHLNEALKSLNEWLVSRRTMRRSISYMGNKFLKMFQGPNNAVSDEPSYTHNSIELQLRQLADMAFLLQNYDLAMQSYQHLKKDFQGASAWLYYAGVVEMIGMSTYLMSSTRREVVSYLEEAISVYYSSCKAPHYGLRVSLVLSEIQKERGLYRDLTQLYIKMTAEDDDLRSAVCVEQAAHAFLRIQPSMARKYALHLILAGHRYARVAQRVHSTRSYKQALAVYKGHGWTLAEDYIHFSLARHSFSLHRLLDARMAFESLLCHEGSHSPSQQLLYLKDYIYVHRQLLQHESSSYGDQVTLDTPTTCHSHIERLQDVPTLPLPLVNSRLTRVTFATKATPPPLKGKSLLSGGGGGGNTLSLAKPRASSFNVSTTDNKNVTNLKNLHTNSQSSEDLNTVEANLIGIGEHLRSIETQSHHSSSMNLIIGAQDYDPSRSGATANEWEELEMRAATGCEGVQRENFTPSTLVMDCTTDNSKMPNCVVNEPVAVGIVVKNPLAIPLLMTKFTLVWQFTSGHTPSSTPLLSPKSPLSPSLSSSSTAAGTTCNNARGFPFSEEKPAASCQVIEQIELHPNEQRMVTVPITPLREGELEVLGFIYNLCVEGSQSKGATSPLPSSSSRANLLSMSVNSRESLYQVHQGSGVQAILSEGVQGVVNVQVKGPRLNGTKVERASVVYGKDHRLHWKVTPPMPKLLSCLTHVPSSLLSGEVCRVGVEVYNVGQVALNSLRITSSLGHQLLLETDSNSSREQPIYPSSILSPINRSPPPTSLLPPRGGTPRGTRHPCIDLPLPKGRLEPGEGVKMSLILQGLLPPSLFVPSTEVPWHILFYYEPALITANSRISHRVVRHSSMLKVRECAHFTARATHAQLPSVATNDQQENRFDINQLIISVEAENRCQLIDSSAIELRVLQVSCASSQWTINKMDKQQSIMTLLPSESGVIHLKASRITQSHSQSQLYFSDVPFGPTMVPSSDFPTRELFRGKQVASLKDNNNGSTGEGDQDNDITLMIFWQALVPSGGDIVFSYGHCTLSVPLPHSMAAISKVPSHASSLQSALKFYLEHTSSHRHPPFSSKSKSMELCRVPVSLVLQNCSQHKLKAKVELSPAKEAAATQESHKRPASQLEPTFFWSGGTCKKQVVLEADSTKTLTIVANFGRPGVYNLSTARIMVALWESSDYHEQTWRRTSYITIQ